MNPDESRWTVPDLDTAVRRCEAREAEGIRCILHRLGEYASDEAQCRRSADESVRCLRIIAERSPDTSLSLKLSDFGALFDPELCRELTAGVLAEARSLGVAVEIDMEGRPLVPFTLGLVKGCAAREYPFRLTLQAYLNRTEEDLTVMRGLHVEIRLVKGAYLGDVTDFNQVRARFRTLFDRLAASGGGFQVGTHDPDLVAWMRERMQDRRGAVEFGFLMGLADRTKRDLAAAGWRVAEYVPFGGEAGAYIARRQTYLAALTAMGRRSLP